MTDSGNGPKLGKRERLVAGARDVIHQQGVEKTTIADIAQAAEVPVGNVYYYFKTKDELVGAAIDSHARDVRAMLDSLERHRTPQARLKSAARSIYADASESIQRSSRRASRVMSSGSRKVLVSSAIPW